MSAKLICDPITSNNIYPLKKTTSHLPCCHSPYKTSNFVPLLLISWSVSPIPSESTKKGYELGLKSGPLLHKKWPSYDA